MASRDKNPLVEKHRYLPDPKDYSDRQGYKVSQVVLHCTGGAIVDRGIVAVMGDKTWRTKLEVIKDEDLCEKVGKFVAQWYSHVNEVSTTFVIDWVGNVWQTLSERWRAWSAGISERRLHLYRQGFAEWSKWTATSGPIRQVDQPKRYDFWVRGIREIVEADPRCKEDEQWREVFAYLDSKLFRRRGSPLLLFDEHTNPDWTSVSVDLISPPYRQRDDQGLRLVGPDEFNGDLYPKRQLTALKNLLRELEKNYPKFKRTRAKVLPHSMTDPLRRHWYKKRKDGTYIGIGWDPGPLDWSYLLG